MCDKPLYAQIRLYARDVDNFNAFLARAAKYDWTDSYQLEHQAVYWQRRFEIVLAQTSKAPYVSRKSVM